jgi:NitT/TauT family transport system substrate-binding protein
MPIKLTENFRALFYAPFYATQALGFYDREGVDVELRPSPAPAAAAADLLDGTIDLSWGGPMRVMKAREDNPNSPLVCFCEVVARDPFFLMGRGDPSAFRLADLSELRFATVSEVPTPWLCLQQDLRDAGVELDRLGRVTNRTMADNLEALRKGDLDVAQLFEPYVSMALTSGTGRILYTASTRGPTVYTAFLATRDSIARNRTAFAAMVRAVRRMQAWLQEHSVEELATTVSPSTLVLQAICWRAHCGAITKQGCGPNAPRYRAKASLGLPQASSPAASSPGSTTTTIAWIRAFIERHGLPDRGGRPRMQTLAKCSTSSFAEVRLSRPRASRFAMSRSQVRPSPQ